MDLQCAMCRAVLESGADQKAAESSKRWDCLLNDGYPLYTGRSYTLYFIYIKIFQKTIWLDYKYFFYILLLCICKVPM